MDSISGPVRARANRDINPSQQLVAAHPDLACLLHNKPVSAAFAVHERTAVRWKRIYAFLGRLSLIAILLAMVSFDYQITLKPLYGAPAFLAGLSAGIAAIGLLSQILLGATQAKARWLAARFAAERLRCFKFQLFAVLEEVEDAKGLAARVGQRTTEGLAALAAELQGGRSAILDFSPADVMPPLRRKAARPDKALIEAAASLYDILRFSIETQHFQEQFDRHEHGGKMPSLLSEFSFLAGAALACIGIFVTLLPLEPGSHEPAIGHAAMAWVDFLTWMMFVVSAVVAIHERGSANQQNAERYFSYGREIRRIRGSATAHLPASLLEAVREMELLMLREIQDFCRDVRHSSYIF